MITEPPILIFSINILLFTIILKLFGNKFALDSPGERKIHSNSIPQIGGLIFGFLFLFISLYMHILPTWYVVGLIVSLLLGAIDDLYQVRWFLKLIIQILLVFYFSYIFWGIFDFINFYSFSIPISEIQLFTIFIIWFIGIYNAVNLIDGLDGLAGGFMFIISIALGLSSINEFSVVSLTLSILMLSFLIFNQRPAKLFMGDAGSLFLGFHVAALPLLFASSNPISNELNMTPFVLVATYLIADTTRVFFTRLADKKSPMTADTIHLHHLILQQSGSYLSSIGFIYSLTTFSAVISLISFTYDLSSNYLLLHMSFLLLFILTPPVQSYVPIVIKIVKPIYSWQKVGKKDPLYVYRTNFLLLLLISLIISLYAFSDSVIITSWKHFISIFIISIISFFFRNDKMNIYFIQSAFILLLIEFHWNSSNFNIFSKLFSLLIALSYIIFIFQKRSGCNIRQFSSLDILIICTTIAGAIISFLGLNMFSNIWFFSSLFSIWFGLRFILIRLFYSN